MTKPKVGRLLVSELIEQRIQIIHRSFRQFLGSGASAGELVAANIPAAIWINARCLSSRLRLIGQESARTRFDLPERHFGVLRRRWVFFLPGSHPRSVCHNIISECSIYFPVFGFLDGFSTRGGPRHWTETKNPSERSWDAQEGDTGVSSG